MRFRPVIFAWWLLFGATLAMAGAAWWLLGREADRVESLAAGTLANRTASVAESIDLLMAEVRDGVAEGLLAVREVPEPRIALAELVESNPYLTAGFYFRGSDAVTVWFGERGDLPSPGSIRAADGADATAFPWTLPDFEIDDVVEEKEKSTERQEAAQSKAPSDAFAAAPAPSVVSSDEGVSYGFMSEADEVQQEVVAQNFALKQQREAVRKVNVDNRANVSARYTEAPQALAAAADADIPMSRERRDSEEVGLILGDNMAAPVEAELSESEMSPVRRGWVSLIVGDAEQWMAWVGLSDGANYIGTWLNRQAIDAELSKAINLSQQDGLRFRLIDSQGAVVAGDYTSRYSSSQAPTSPELTLAVGSALPQWRIETFRANGANTFGSSFRWIGGLFIVGLSCAILLGSTVLIWQARRDARDAERKTTFVANVSHELKTPLTSIRLFADMLHDGRVKDAAKQREYLQTMVNETQRLTRLVNNVLDFSRLERGSRRTQTETLDLGAAIQDMIESQRERLLSEGLALNYRQPEALLSVEADRDAIEQILLNLLDNAAKYASSGERADVLLKQESSGWSLRVNDYGSGIPASERKQVFAAFHRSDDRLTSERPGCGLGLSIAARLAEEMGGQLTLEDNVPKGCSFILKIHG